MSTYDVAFSPTDEGAHREVLDKIYTAWFSGERLPAQPRRVIKDSWARMRKAGVHPAKNVANADSGGHSVPPPPPQGAMLDVLPILRGLLDPLLAEDQAMLVLADGEGTILWRGGTNRLLRRADALGFEPRYSWAERSVGTNAIGTALITGTPVHVHAAEHFCLSHHGWSCAAAPVFDPRRQAPVGVIDLSFLATEAQPSAIALATALARQAGWELREDHRRELARLEAATRQPATGPWALVDTWGWVAAVRGMPRVGRIRLPRDLPSTFLVDGLGVVTAVEVAGGWLLVPSGDLHAEVHQPVLRLAQHQCSFSLGADLSDVHTITGRRAEILACLADHPAGMSGRELAQGVYGREDAEVATRAEISRINKELGMIVLGRPYRLAREIQVVDER